MIAYTIRRLFLALVTIWAISVLSFVIIQLPPGDFVDAYISRLSASGSLVSAEEAQTMRKLYGLDRPIYVQYGKWISRVAQGDFGESMEWMRPVTEVIGDRLWLTMVVSVAAIILTWGIALPIGIYSAVRQYSIGDYIFTFIGFIGLAIPNFLFALILMYLSFKFLDLNVGGLFSPDFDLAPWSLAKVWDLLKHLPLPAIVLALAGTAQLIRIMRANLLDELRKPYVVTARAKGLAETRVIMKYPVRAALNPFASSLAYLFPQVVSGSIIVALVLSLPTVGPLLLTSLVAQDMFLAGTIILMLGVMTVIGTFVSDLVLMWIDPRIRFQAGL
jgi:peptide/nickel transport system permease protein